jgi:hypothetical protein
VIQLHYLETGEDGQDQPEEYALFPKDKWGEETKVN